jgi:acetyl/propionyl-CoA carboxylase alpha subunit
MKWIKLDWKGKSVKVPAEKIGGQLWFHWQGETFSYEPPRKTKAGGAAGSAEPGKIKSPMPGKIIKVWVKKGEQVEEGRPLIVMEAMKMEYTLTADLSGSVSALNCAEGQQVTLGQLLVEIKES